MAFSVYIDPILGEARALVDGEGSGGSGGSAYVGGERINIAGGTISFVNSADIVNVTGTSVTLQPDTAYKIYATSQAITLNATPPAAGKWAYDGHIELFVAGTGYVVTGTNVVLANALEPDSVNNCTVRFHDGIAIISVEDHIAGYIVVNGSTSGDGSLAYGIATSTNDYVAFDASLNGTTIPLAGATAEGEKHLVGNGYTETAITGAVDCGTSKFTVANLSLQNVAVNGGTMTLGDAFIPSGATVAVSGGGLAIEKVTGDGGTVDLGGTHVVTSGASASGCVFSGGSAIDQNGNGGALYLYGGINSFSNCVISGNKGTLGGGVSVRSASIILDSCIVSGNTATNGKDIYGLNANLTLSDCTIGSTRFNTCQIELGGSCFIGDIGMHANPNTVTLISGATLDLTGNTNAEPIAPGGGITFEQGGATVKVGDSTASSSYMMDNVALPAGAKLTNTAIVDLGGTRLVNRFSASASGCTFTGGIASGTGNDANGGFMLVSSGAFTASSCTFVGNSAPGGLGGVFFVFSGAAVELTSCTVSGNLGANGGGFSNYGYVRLVDCEITGNTGTGFSNMDSASVADISSCTITGNSAKDLRAANGVTNLTDCTVGIVSCGASLTLAGSNVVQQIVSASASGTVLLTSGASITLTSSIVPGGEITIPAGAVVTIIGSGGSSAYLSELALTGSTITNQPAVLGATVTIPANSETYDVHFADGTSSTYTGGATERQEVLDGAVVYIGAQ